MGFQEMIHVLKKGGVTMSHWIMDSRMNWLKHRLHDYKEPIDTIKIIKEFRNGDLVWNVYFNGKNVEYIQYMFYKIYGNEPFKDEHLEKLKLDIDNLLIKADKLIILHKEQEEHA